jgi:hypothetical protein
MICNDPRTTTGNSEIIIREIRRAIAARKPSQANALRSSVLLFALSACSFISFLGRWLLLRLFGSLVPDFFTNTCEEIVCRRKVAVVGT